MRPAPPHGGDEAAPWGTAVFLIPLGFYRQRLAWMLVPPVVLARGDGTPGVPVGHRTAAPMAVRRRRVPVRVRIRADPDVATRSVRVSGVVPGAASPCGTPGRSRWRYRRDGGDAVQSDAPAYEPPHAGAKAPAHSRHATEGRTVVHRHAPDRVLK